jgi:hypothetical protein
MGTPCRNDGDVLAACVGFRADETADPSYALHADTLQLIGYAALPAKGSSMNIIEWFNFQPKIADFAALVLKAFVAEGLDGWSYDEPGIALRHGSQVMNLANVFQRYVDTPRMARKAVVAQCVEVALHLGRSVPASWSDAKDRIFPVLRSRYEFSSIQAEHRDEPHSLPDMHTWNFCGDLHIRLAYDFGSGTATVGQNDIAAWNIATDTILDCARKNLSTLPAPTWQHIGAGVYQLVSSVAYEESMMLIDSVVSSLAFGNSAVLVACNRGGLLAADRNSHASIAAMLVEARRRLIERPWPLSSTLCTRINGQWQEFVGSGEVAALQRSLHAVSMTQIYAGQKDSLDRSLERVGEDIFVATCGVVEFDRALLTWCTWVEGINSLLPKTDYIAFSRREGAGTTTSILAAWDDVTEIVEKYLEKTEEDPPRFFVNRFPSEEEWRSICTFARPGENRISAQPD